MSEELEMNNNLDNKNPDKKEKKELTGFPRYFLCGGLSTYITAYIMMLVGSIAGSIILGIVFTIFGVDTNGHPVLETASLYLSFIGIWVVFSIFILIRSRFGGYARKIFGKITKRTWLMLLLGFFIVGGLNFICIVGAKLHQDIILSFETFDIGPFLFLLISVFIQSSAEELICRGYVYRRIEACYKNSYVAMVLNSLLFALLHLGNDGVTILSLLNIFLSGILFSLAVYYTDSLAFAFAGHTGWNFCQSIIFGLPNSGAVFPYSFFKLDASNARDSFFYNCGFGVEGTVFSVIMLVLGCVIIVLLGKMGILKKREKNPE